MYHYYEQAKKISKNHYKTKNGLRKAIERVQNIYLEARKKEKNTINTSLHENAIFDTCYVMEVLDFMQIRLHEW